MLEYDMVMVNVCEGAVVLWHMWVSVKKSESVARLAAVHHGGC